MRESLQPYLPNFHPKESAPYKGSEHLIVEHSNGDYYIYLTPEGAKKACTFKRMGAVSIFDTIEATFIAEDGRTEILGLTTTFDSQIFHHPDCHDRIYFQRDEKGPWVVVARWLIGNLLTGERDFVVTRYDGHTNKIWIRMAEEGQFQAAA